MDSFIKWGGVILKRLWMFLTALIMILSSSVAFAEENPDEVIREWEEKYGDQRLWDYQVNAAHLPSRNLGDMHGTLLRGLCFPMKMLFLQMKRWSWHTN